ncbi:hypothetical protein BGZ61DRAFT_454454 [Ilyonectria robusta]|uniref:uncharacterized protein n=1 Tax=Ilyonectria robusta TaxID=1079257 RepID=UPI001E8D23BB|nr:uncharacterized protein BGZ61DRAFT_454454 [Ilyonectria robusta]KAH8686414.1 hypothetical protein BGZ61DRAFT_454454 [Ilyonectria robusta]
MPSSSESQLPGLPGYDPHDLQPWTMQVVVSMTVLSLTSVALRLLSRHLKGQQLWWDDWVILFSAGWNLVVVGFIFAMYSCGMGIHADLVDPKDIVMMAKWLVVAEILYAFNLGWTKLSLLLMYYRIFRVPYFKKMAWIVGTFVMAWVVTITFLFVFICIPVEKLWYPHLPGHCINQVGTWIANAASTILTDFIILLLPLRPIWRLQLGKGEKFGLMVAFGLGFFVVFASAYRTSVLFTYTATDPTYSLAPTVGWTAIEMSAGIVSANLPTMLPVLRLFARYTGLQSLVGTVRGSASRSKADRSAFSKGTSREDAEARPAPNAEPNGRGDAFYRLPDDTESDGTVKKANSALSPVVDDLRPDIKGYEFTVKSYKSNTDRGDESGDEIPLQGIRVQRQFRRSTSGI